MSDLKKTEPVTQENLPEALADGRITQAEIDRIWGLTEFLSAQTPIELRMMLVRAQDLGIALPPHEQLMISLLYDMRALMTKDESKFAHLVAGTETIVKTLQKVNPLVERLRRQEEMIDSLANQLDRAEGKIDALLQAMAEGGKVTVKHEVYHGGDEEAAYLAEVAAESVAAAMAEPTEEPYDGCVGSSWDPANPVKPPIKLEKPSEEYERQSKEFRERILKHS